MRKKTKVDIYTDGSVYPKNPGNGGWGAVLIFRGKKRVARLEIGGPIEGDQTTNNQAETIAVIKAIDALKKGLSYHLRIYTDSRYVFLGLKRLINKTLPVSNVHIWTELRDEINFGKHKIEPIKIKGHSGHHQNSRAHDVAYDGARNRQHHRELKEWQLGQANAPPNRETDI